jgi:hypothetical protein
VQQHAAAPRVAERQQRAASHRAAHQSRPPAPRPSTTAPVCASLCATPPAITGCARHSLPRLDRAGEGWAISALKAAEDGDALVLRVWNPGATAGRLTIEGAVDLRRRADAANPGGAAARPADRPARVPARRALRRRPHAGLAAVSARLRERARRRRRRLPLPAGRDAGRGGVHGRGRARPVRDRHAEVGPASAGHDRAACARAPGAGRAGRVGGRRRAEKLRPLRARNPCLGRPPPAGHRYVSPVTCRVNATRSFGGESPAVAPTARWAG